MKKALPGSISLFPEELCLSKEVQNQHCNSNAHYQSTLLKAHVIYSSPKSQHPEEVPMGNGRVYKRANKFTQVSNAVLQDDTLSLRAKGLYSLINCFLTIPNFTLYKTFLKAHCREGQQAFENVWKELKNSGYFIQHKLKNSQTGSFYYEYELLDEKTHTPGFEGVGKVEVEKTGDGGAGAINNTEVNKTDFSNTTNTTHTDSPKPPGTSILPDNPSKTEEKTACPDNPLALQEEIKRITGCKVPLKKVRELIANSSAERIKYHLASWHIHKQHQKSEGAGWFFTVVEHDIAPEEKKQGLTWKRKGEEQTPQPVYFTATDKKAENIDTHEKRVLSEAALTAISSMYKMLGVQKGVNK